jgi:hypothetical protein
MGERRFSSTHLWPQHSTDLCQIKGSCSLWKQQEQIYNLKYFENTKWCPSVRTMKTVHFLPLLNIVIRHKQLAMFYVRVTTTKYTHRSDTSLFNDALQCYVFLFPNDLQTIQRKLPQHNNQCYKFLAPYFNEFSLIFFKKLCRHFFILYQMRYIFSFEFFFRIFVPG